MEIAKQLIFIIFDRWGYREEREHNAIAQAHTPCFDRLWRQYPHALLEASGEAVGLPPGQIGGSEVGHLTIGAGKIIDNDFVRINKAAAAREFATNPAFKQLFAHVKKHDSTLQVLGMVSPGGVHSHQEHLHEFLRVAKQARITKVVIHAFTDGRDMEPQSAHKYLRELEQVIEDLGIGYIATATGRFYAMDRDTNWDRVAKAEAAIFAGQGTPAQTRKPFLFNFRADRMRQIGKKISDRVNEDNLCFVTMTEYDQANRSLNCLVAFPQVDIETTLAQEISRAGLTQAHIAETEKYAHVTFFLNGAKEHQFPGEEYVLIDSRKDVRTHDLAPEMKAREIVDAALQRLDRGVQVVIINFANPDLVGHTGNFAATVTAIETVDRELSRLAAYAEKNSITMFITADHGNAEINVYKESGSKHTAHSINPVPAILTRKGAQLNNGTLADVAPTLLELLGIPKPAAMTGRSLLC
jgi:2,3-bisphosphoglycerate-independent phosphoglycerate mutase